MPTTRTNIDLDRTTILPLRSSSLLPFHPKGMPIKVDHHPLRDVEQLRPEFQGLEHLAREAGATVQQLVHRRENDDRALRSGAACPLLRSSFITP